MKVDDVLYGGYELPFDVMLDQWHVSRTDKLFLTSVYPSHHLKAFPHWPTFYQHTCGVSYLTQILLGINKTPDKDKEIAAFLHDVGRAVFYENTEQVLRDYNAAARGRDICLGDLAGHIRAFGGNLERVAGLVRGREKAPTAGTLTLDSIDMTQRLAAGLEVITKCAYDGIFLAGSYRLGKDGWALIPQAKKQVKMWHTVRKLVLEHMTRDDYLGRSALLNAALSQFRKTTGVLDSLARWTDAAALTALASHDPCVLYISALQQRTPVNLVARVCWSVGANDEQVRSHVAGELGVPEGEIVSAAPLPVDLEVEVPFTDGTAFTATLQRPQGFLAIYSMRPIEKKLDLTKIGLTPYTNDKRIRRETIIDTRSYL